MFERVRKTNSNKDSIVKSKEFGFYAYAANPVEIGQTIEQAVSIVNINSELSVNTWKSLDIPGHFGNPPEK